jgi:hypothetical protein
MENRDEKRNYYVTIEEYQSNPKYYEKEAASVRKILHVTRTPEQSEEHRKELGIPSDIKGEECNGYKIYSIWNPPNNNGMVVIMVQKGNEPGQWLEPVPTDKANAYLEKLRQNLKDVKV